MLQILLIRPGSTDMDEQGRIKGSLDLPLSEHGKEQAAQTAAELAAVKIDYLYAAPCQSCLETAQAVAKKHKLKVRTLDTAQNVDHGLWHGRLVDEVRQTQPRVYRQLQEHPETVCPPNGEPLVEAEQRIRTVFEKVLRKHPVGVVAIVVPEPLTSLIRSYLSQSEVGDLWKVECACGGWESIEVVKEKLAMA